MRTHPDFQGLQPTRAEKEERLGDAGGKLRNSRCPQKQVETAVFFRQGHSSQAVNLDRGSACVSVRALGCPEREHDLGEELGRALE